MTHACCNHLTARWLKPVLLANLGRFSSSSLLTVRWLKLKAVTAQINIYATACSPQGDWNPSSETSDNFTDVAACSPRGDWNSYMPHSSSGTSLLQHAHRKVIETTACAYLPIHKQIAIYLPQGDWKNSTLPVNSGFCGCNSLTARWLKPKATQTKHSENAAGCTP